MLLLGLVSFLFGVFLLLIARKQRNKSVVKDGGVKVAGENSGVINTGQISGDVSVHNTGETNVAEAGLLERTLSVVGVLFTVGGTVIAALQFLAG